MRILHIVTAFPRTPEDVITPWLVELAVRSRRRGHRAEVLAPAWRGGGATEHRGVPVHRFRYAPAPWETLTHEETVPDRLRRSPGHAALVPLYLAGGSLASLRLGREAPDVVHVHWPVPHALFGALVRAASGGRTALVCSFYAVESNWVEARLRPLLPFLRWSARTADGLTAISTSTARSVERLTGVAPAVVPFAAAVEEALEDGGEREGRAGGAPRPPLAGEGPLELLFVGRLVERKGVEYLVRALALLLPHRDVRLTVVGEGAWEAEIRRVVREVGLGERVRFTGFLSADGLSRAYRRCDIFVLPAVVDRKGDTEGLGVVLLEALRHGRPVVASDVGGIPDIVRPGRTGWLVPPADPTALARTLLEVAEDPEGSRRLARRGRRYAETRFGWPRILEKLEGVYREATDRRSLARSRGSRGRRASG